jgi:hypothetical protein
VTLLSFFKNMNTSNDSNTVSTPVCATDTTKNSELCNEPGDPRQSTVGGQPAVSDTSKNSELCILNSDLKTPSTLNPQPAFNRDPNETPRAFNAFTTYFRLGHSRTLQVVADKLGEQLPTVKNWSSKYDWSERINHFNSGLLEQQAQAEAETARKAAADWARRTQLFREQEWESGQRLLAVVRCCLENFGDRELEKIRLSELSRALNVVSKMSHSALQNPAAADDRPALAPIQNELLAALRRMPDPAAPPPPVAVVPPTTTHSKN